MVWRGKVCYGATSSGLVPFGEVGYGMDLLLDRPGAPYEAESELTDEAEQFLRGTTNDEGE